MPGDVIPQYFATPADLDSWLSENGDTSPGAWIVCAKKNSPMATVTYEQALLVALAHGWIDGHTKSLDADAFIQRFSPRRPKGTWSLRNVRRVEALIASGSMHPRGLAEVEKAQADGRWAKALDPLLSRIHVASQRD